MLDDYSTDVNDIAPGYRNITYKNINGEGHIILFGYSKSTQKPQTFIIPHSPRVLYQVRYETPIKDIYGNSLAKKEFKNVYERRKWLDAKGIIKVIEAFKPEEEFLHDHFDPYVLEPDFNIQPLHYHFIDIETEVSDEFERPVTARNRINLITVYDTQEDKYFSWALTNVKNTFQDDRHILFNFSDNEPKLLRSFVNWFSQHYPDVISSWNGLYYDIPYLTRRIENVLGESYAKKLSPIQSYRIRETNTDNKRGPKSEQIFVKLEGISQLDLLLLYRDKFTVKASLDGGYGLSNVGEAENLGKKIEYDGTIKDFYMRDFQRFYEYNVRDVELVVKIEEKCQLIPLARKIASSGLCQYESIYASVGYITGSLCAYAKNKYNEHFPSFINEQNIDRRFEGAYVFPTQQGVYHNGIMCCDVNSLYPSTIITTNISPETYIGKLMEPYDKNAEEYHLKLEKTGQIKTLTNAQMNELLNKKAIVSKNDTLFIKHEFRWGVIAAWCKDFFKRRKAIKNEGFKYTVELHELKDQTSEYAQELKRKIANCDVSQKGLKTLINSCYGLFGTIYSPFYNPDLAQTITRNGQFTNRTTADYIIGQLKIRYGFSENAVGVISGDTDSTTSQSSLYIKRTPVYLR